MAQFNNSSMEAQNELQRFKTDIDLVSFLTKKEGYKVATMLKPLSTFWKAEDYHQQYYEHKGTTPYCHVYKKIFE